MCSLSTKLAAMLMQYDNRIRDNGCVTTLINRVGRKEGCIPLYPVSLYKSIHSLHRYCTHIEQLAMGGTVHLSRHQSKLFVVLIWWEMVSWYFLTLCFISWKEMEYISFLIEAARITSSFSTSDFAKEKHSNNDVFQKRFVWKNRLF